MREFIWDEVTCEFVEVFGMDEYPDGGNRVVVTMDGDLPRFKVEIDDFGCVMGALCRLVQRIVPTFQFPEVEKPRRTILRRNTTEGIFGG